MLSDATKRQLARTAFAHTAAYDAAIVGWFDDGAGDPLPADASTSRSSGCRTSATARTRTRPAPATARSAPRRGGTTSSSTAAWRSATSTCSTPTRRGAWPTTSPRTTGRPAVAIIKHANPCGAAVADTLAEAYQRAFECDERSAFGGIVALSHPVDDATVERMVAAAQADVVIAPGLRRRRRRGAARQAQEHPAAHGAAARRPTRTRSASSPASWLVQDAHHFAADARRLAGRHQAGADRRGVGRRRARLAARAAG